MAAVASRYSFKACPSRAKKSRSISEQGKSSQRPKPPTAARQKFGGPFRSEERSLKQRGFRSAEVGQGGPRRECGASMVWHGLQDFQVAVRETEMQGFPVGLQRGISALFVANPNGLRDRINKDFPVTDLPCLRRLEDCLDGTVDTVIRQDNLDLDLRKKIHRI